ncbi:Nucleotide-binding universal stress protein, UspA family [Cribrihabitans marinus]|uniref:Nucleotide-binding universal stress protein, UspA family n=1 Tax=Cribrihabitans marinus TaxID=1227549 RepID=A0A1H6QSA1_9RHOB|nr:universal stress protein [Cribrihabitans marinus]GGH18733.1 hypothetical protein GCM10010973_01710 [Cribrihabitans marinus]SEI42360.1 Nucleotide-binding universal stress protein, UspA family [Cribrihabitans marinus]
MFSKIMVPVDISHPGQLTRALTAAADLGRHYGAEVCYVAVTSSAPGTLGHTPDEARGHLAEFSEAQAAAHGHRACCHLALSHDPAVDLDRTLLAAIEETGADLVVMASHVPGWADSFTGSHGGHLAAEAKVSVFVVRGE